MGAFHCAFLEVTRKPIRTIVILLVFVLIFTGEMLGLSLMETSQYAKEDVLRQIGSKITLERKDFYEGSAPVTADMIEQVTNTEHVITVNRTIADFAQPLNFSNCKISEGIDPKTQSGSAAEVGISSMDKDSIIIEGNLDTSVVDEFRTGYSILIEGEYPNIMNPGALIEEHLANENNLSIGDKITITLLSDQSFEQTLAITGTYRTKATFEISKSNPVGEDVYAHSPYNRIFTDLGNATSAFNENEEDLGIDIFLDSPNNIEQTGVKIKSMDFDWEKYQLINTTETIYQQNAKQVDVVSNYAKIILFYVTAAGVILLLLILSIWSKSYDYDSGVLIAIGAPKKRALSQFFLATTYIAAVGYGISMILSMLISDIIVNRIVDSTVVGMSTYNSFVTGKELDATIQVLPPELITYLVFFCIVLAFIFAACLFPLYHLIRFKPNQILSDR